MISVARLVAYNNDQEQGRAFQKMILGRSLGMDPAQSLGQIDWVSNKPELSANAQAALLRAYVGPWGERYDYEIQRIDNEAVELAFMRLWPDKDPELLGLSEFTIEDAKRANLAGKDTYTAYPRNMLFSRAISNGVAWYCPEVTRGTRVYSQGELNPDREHPIPAVPGEQSPEPAASPQAAQLPAAPELPESARRAAEHFEQARKANPANQPQAQATPQPPAPADVPRPSREDYAALGAARKAAGLSDEQVHELFDQVGVQSAPSLRVRAQNMTREQLTSAIARLEFTQPAADDQPDSPPPAEPVQEAIPGTAEEMPTGQPTEGVMGA